MPNQSLSSIINQTPYRPSTKQTKPSHAPLDTDTANRIMKDATDPAKNPWCQHCGDFHLSKCPRVRRMEWRGGEIVSVDFWHDWNHDDCYTQLEVAEAADAEEDELPIG